MRSVIHVLRWVAVLPGAILAWIAAAIVVRTLYPIALATYFDPDSLVARWQTETAAAAAASLAAIVTGAYLAPQRKSRVAVAVAILGVLNAGASLVLATNGWSIYGSVIVAVTCGLMAWHILRGGDGFWEDDASPSTRHPANQDAI